MTRARLLTLALATAAAASAGCGGGAHRAATNPETASASAAGAAGAPSRPGIAGEILVTLERQDLQFGRHDTLTIGRDGRANLVLAHGGGGFRNAACAFPPQAMAALRRDLTRLPVDEPAPRRPKRPRTATHYDGVIHARPGWFAVTYRGRRDVFMEDAMPADGAPLARALRLVLDHRAGDCRVTFHRP